MKTLFFDTFQFFSQKFAVNVFLKFFAERLIRSRVFFFLKIIFHHDFKWNHRKKMKLNRHFETDFCLCFCKWTFGACRFFFLALLALVTLEIISGNCRFEILLGAYLFEMAFERLSLWKCFFGTCCFEIFWALFLLKMFFWRFSL